MNDNQKVAAAWDALRSVLDGDETSLASAIKKLVATNKTLEAKLKRSLNFESRCQCKGTLDKLEPCLFHRTWLRSRLKLAEGED
jgi:hypothetical protein